MVRDKLQLTYLPLTLFSRRYFFKILCFNNEYQDKTRRRKLSENSRRIANDEIEVSTRLIRLHLIGFW